jgi:predicted membrane channel-forming protein YqfA (hemolysin III family)
VARQRHDIARWLALLTLGQLPVLLLLISVMVADMTYGVAWFFLAALFSLLLIGQAWRAWNWRWRKRRLAAGGGG